MFGKKVVLLGISVLIGIAIVQRSVKAWAGKTSPARTSEAISQVQAVKPLSLNLVDEAITVLAQGWPEMGSQNGNLFFILRSGGNG